nr:Chain B, pepTM [synthetic construct]3L3Q_C Chain C, pepTM [synthetic construct]
GSEFESPFKKKRREA